jgi:hypothetical protein
MSDIANSVDITVFTYSRIRYGVTSILRRPNVLVPVPVTAFFPCLYVVFSQTLHYTVQLHGYHLLICFRSCLLFFRNSLFTGILM